MKTHTKISRKKKLNDYDAFVEKFKPKRTTDDCFTPPHVYDVVLDWARRKCNIPDGARIIRPFYPGGDFENFDYQPGDVVVDNPPFSILSKIKRFYGERNIPFFLFAPTLTMFSSDEGQDLTYIYANADVLYDNGAKVNTSFVTNMWPKDSQIVVAGDLYKEIDAVQKRVTGMKLKEIPRNKYPKHLVYSGNLRALAVRGISMEFERKETHFVRCLDSQKGEKKAIYGSGFLISERLAAERLAAERLAAERLAAERLAERRTAVWELSEREREIISRLSQNNT